MNDLETYLKELSKILKSCFLMIRLYGLEKSIELLELTDKIIKEGAGNKK